MREFERQDDGKILSREAGATGVLDPAEWPRYRKKVETAAILIAGPFTVRTSEGPLTCEEGFLAVDARGYPYPIAADEFELIYEAVEEATS